MKGREKAVWEGPYLQYAVFSAAITTPHCHSGAGMQKRKDRDKHGASAAHAHNIRGRKEPLVSLMCIRMLENGFNVYI